IQKEKLPVYSKCHGIPPPDRPHQPCRPRTTRETAMQHWRTKRPISSDDRRQTGILQDGDNGYTARRAHITETRPRAGQEEARLDDDQITTGLFRNTREERRAIPDARGVRPRPPAEG